MYQIIRLLFFRRRKGFFNNAPEMDKSSLTLGGQRKNNLHNLKHISMEIWDQIAEYLYLKKKDKNKKPDHSIRMMHGMNKISLIIFLSAMGILLFRLFKH